MHHKAGRIAVAVAYYQRILTALHCTALHCTALHLHAEANTHLGALLLQQGHAKRAIPYLKTARQCQPHRMQNWLRLLHALQVIGDDSHAAQLLEAAVQFNLPAAELERQSRNLNNPPE
jgi:Tfp pilus assembly protein PilF